MSGRQGSNNKRIGDFIGIPGLGNLGILGIDSNLDMEYLEGRNEENKSEENNNESDLDDESNASDDNERDSDLQSSNRNEEEKEFAVPHPRSRLNNLGNNLQNQEDEDDIMESESQNQEEFNFVEEQNAETINDKYEVPVLYRSQKAGCKYRLSEILVPRAKEVIEANLKFNEDHMQNKLLRLSHDSTKEAKKKVEE